MENITMDILRSSRDLKEPHKFYGPYNGRRSVPGIHGGPHKDHGHVLHKVQRIWYYIAQMICLKFLSKRPP